MEEILNTIISNPWMLLFLSFLIGFIMGWFVAAYRVGHDISIGPLQIKPPEKEKTSESMSITANKINRSVIVDKIKGDIIYRGE